MNLSQHKQHPLENRLLAALPATVYARLQPQLEEVELHLGDVLYRPGEKITHVYFPHRGTISVVALMQDGKELEVGIIGNEGMLGLPVVLGTNTSPLHAIVQIPDGATRLGADVLAAEIRQCGELQQGLLRYAQAFFMQTALNAACNRLHSLDGRLIRWLLMCQDRVKADELQLTHEFIATMLGVRRAGVTEAATQLQVAGLIAYRRGHVRILDRKGLEAATCECYGIIRQEFAQLPA